MTPRAAVSLGVAASIGPEMAALLAPAAEEAGFHALWVNDAPGADALAVLASAARTTERLILATGVLPVDRRTATQIAAEVVALEIPQRRLVLGIGSGQSRAGSLGMVGSAASELHESVSSPVLVGALGPRMRRLAVKHSDGVLLNWVTPTVARAQAVEAQAVAPRAHVAVYVRASASPAALPRLHLEAAHYAGSPAYAANFARLGMAPADTVLDAATGVGAQRLDEYRMGVDEVVLRAITADHALDDYLRFIDVARTML